MSSVIFLIINSTSNQQTFFDLFLKDFIAGKVKKKTGSGSKVIMLHTTSQKMEYAAERTLTC